MGGARALRQGGHGACPMTPAAPAPAPAMATTLSSLRRKRGNEGECSESTFLRHATKKDSPCSAASLRAAALVVAATREERRAPQDCSRASLPRRVRAVGGESSPGDPAAPSSSVPMGIVLAVVVVASCRAGEVDGRGEALRKLRRQRRRRLAVMYGGWEVEIKNEDDNLVKIWESGKKMTIFQLKEKVPDKMRASEFFCRDRAS